MSLRDFEDKEANKSLQTSNTNQKPASLSSYIQQDSLQEKSKNYYIFTEDGPTFRNQTKAEKPRNLSSTGRIETKSNFASTVDSGSKFQFPRSSSRGEENFFENTKVEVRRPSSTSNKSLIVRDKSSLSRDGSLTKRVTFAQDEAKVQDQSRSYREDDVPWREPRVLQNESNSG